MIIAAIAIATIVLVAAIWHVYLALVDIVRIVHDIQWQLFDIRERRPSLAAEHIRRHSSK